MLKQTKHFLARVGRDCRGASVVETSLIAPTMLMLLAGVSDVAMAYSVKLHTQQAAVRTIEYATAAGLENVTFDDLRAEASDAANVPLSQVKVMRWLECDGALQTIFEGSCEGGQEIARYVSIQISNSYQPVLGPLLPDTLAEDGEIAFDGYSTARLQ